jgi:OOP family OmpA-OmpF porin
MRARLIFTAVACVALPFLASLVAEAQPVTGPYVSGGAGYNIEFNQNVNDGVAGSKTFLGNAKIDTKNGVMGEGSAGYGFGDGFRVELEGDYYNNQFSKTGSDNATPVGGREQKYGLMTNAFYDFNLGTSFVFPYIGAGFGYQQDDFTNFHTYNGVSAHSTKGAFAGQAIIGLAFPIAAVPGLSVTGDYRMLALMRTRKYDAVYNGVPGTFKAKANLNNTFVLGVRYQLFQPAPPPQPTPEPVAAPAPAPAKTYLVFFDWDKYSLTPRALDIIAQAASDSKTQSTTTIAVNGYTDTSGNAVYNQGLSVRRAKAVEAQLVTDGVPASEITAHGFGDTDLLVPTGPGVREPQNRRVQIVLQ